MGSGEAIGVRGGALGGRPQVFQNTSGNNWIRNRSDQTHPLSTTGATKRINFEDALRMMTLISLFPTAGKSAANTATKGRIGGTASPEVRDLDVFPVFSQ